MSRNSSATSFSPMVGSGYSDTNPDFFSPPSVGAGSGGAVGSAAGFFPGAKRPSPSQSASTWNDEYSWGKTVPAAAWVSDAEDGRQKLDDVDEDDEDDESVSDIDDGFWLGYAEPDTARRRCTDPLWLLPFMLGVAGLVYLRVAGVPRANMETMQSFADWQGKLCGRGDYERFKYLFACQIEGELDLAYVLCRESCPTGSNTSYPCMRSSLSMEPAQEPVLVADYPSIVVAGLVCKPASMAIHRPIFMSRKNKYTDVVSASFLQAVRAWPPFAVVVVMAFVGSIAYLSLLRHCAHTVVWAGMTLLTLVPLAYGGVALHCWRYQELCRFVGDLDQLQKLVVAVASCTCGLVFGCLMLRQGTDIELAISCIEWSIKCILQSPLLAMHPMFVLASRVGLIALAFDVVAGILSRFHEDLVTFRVNPDMFDICLGLYVFIMLQWIMHVISANSFFVEIYVAQTWYFHGGLTGKKVKLRFTYCRAVWLVLRYHQGTLVLGAMATGFTEFVRAFLRFITSFARMEGNPVGRCIRGICCCAVECYEEYFQALNRNAYMDVAMSSHAFWQAAGVGQRVLAADAAVHVLNGATGIFRIAGMGSIAVAGFLTTQLAVGQGILGNSFTNPTEADYVYNRFVHAIYGACIAAGVSFPFMMLFDVVADVVLFCHTVEELRRQAKESKEPEEQMEDGWMGGIQKYIVEVTGCACSFRPKEVAGHQSAPVYEQVAAEEARTVAKAVAPFPALPSSPPRDVRRKRTKT